MAPDNEAAIENSARAEDANHETNDAQPPTAAPNNVGAGLNGGSPLASSEGKRHGDVGRAEWSRRCKSTAKRAKQNDWREFKRRKIDKVTDGLADDRKNPFSKEEIAAEERRPKRKVAVMIGYAGTGYKGMQVNGDEPTIERDLFQAFIGAGAISKANADDPRKSSLARCARTDKGVHAAGNVISLKLIIDDDGIVDKINALLPAQIRVWGIQRTNNSFNCYQYCDSRWYEYLMPSYCLLPPHPQTYLGRKVAQLAEEYGARDELAAKMADVKNFWADVDDKEVRPILEALDPDLKATVLERVHMSESEPGDETTATSSSAAAAKEEQESKRREAPAQAEATVPDAAPDQATAPTADSTLPPATTKILPTAPSRHRELGPVDYALRDIKSVYVAAKRRYRISPERLQQLQTVLDKYVGTHNFHNYTVQKPYSDPSAKRHIKSFVVSPKPVVIGNTEWLSLKVHGQSFMMHQIRKMVGLASLTVRCGATPERVSESYASRKMAIPKAPGLGLLLERPVFEKYNLRARDSLNRPEIDFDQYKERLESFKEEQIYQRIFQVEEKENTFHAFFNQIDQFKSHHFLWLTAGGLDVADISKEAGAAAPEDVGRELGDADDEDPEGGEG